jgi:uncharacterized damage-inducible protein DinB
MACILALAAAPAMAQAPQAKKAPPPPPRPAGTLADETLAAWNDIGRKLMAMAEDMPEEKYWYQPTREVRTFGGMLLHVAAANYFFTNAVANREVGTATDDPPGEQFKSKASVVAFLKKSFADGAETIKAQGEAGMARTLKHPFANRMTHAQILFWEGIEHAGEHYGNLVTYYRLNNMVPPESRPRR